MEHTGCTSIQTILIDHNKEGRRQRLAQLFRRKSYQIFQLPQPSPHVQLNYHPIFQYFTSILREWNTNAQQARLPLFSDTEYYRNVFIYDTLKKAAVQSPKTADLLLRQLEDWHSKDRKQTLYYVPTRPQGLSSTDEEWELRKTFRSNLPTEIQNYRRKVYMDEALKNEPMIVKSVSRWRKVKTEAEYDPQQKEEALSTPKLMKIQNIKLRGQKENNEFSSIQNKWKIDKSRFDELGVKSYYQGEFFRDKRMRMKQPFRRSKKIENSKPNPKRVKSSFDFSRDSLIPSLAHISEKKLPLPPTIKEGSSQKTSVKSIVSQHTQLEPLKQNSQFQFQPVQSIDGMRLLSNPFQTNLKRRKRNN